MESLFLKRQPVNIWFTVDLLEYTLTMSNYCNLKNVWLPLHWGNICNFVVLLTCFLGYLAKSTGYLFKYCKRWATGSQLAGIFQTIPSMALLALSFIHGDWDASSLTAWLLTPFHPF